MSTETSTDRLAGTWRLSQMHSSVEFAVNFIVTEFRGRFEEFDACLQDGKLGGAAKVESLPLKDEVLRRHVMSPEFFDVENHPEIVFSSDSIEVTGDRVEVVGEVTINGRGKVVRGEGAISGPVDDPFGRRVLGFSLRAALDRSAFGMSWNDKLSTGVPMLGDEVSIHLELELVEVA